MSFSLFKYKLFILIILLSASCSGQNSNNNENKIVEKTHAKDSNEVEKYYEKYKNNLEKTISLGSVSNGSMKNGKLIPFTGENFKYFDTLSYLSGRAFVHENVLSSTLDAYQSLAELIPSRKFQIMECSLETGGKIAPHRTHQNGMSIDFMTPLKKDNKPYYDLDSLGTAHYFLDFDKNGKNSSDSTVLIDFEMVAQHILILNENAKKHGLKINKVIFKMELKDELFSGFYGKQLLKSGIYITKNLSPIINSLHDDHYHIDFEAL